MTYMSVKHRDEKSLVLLKEPTFFSIAIFIAFLIGALGVFTFGSEPLFLKVIVSIGAVGISCFLLDNYEICEFDRTKSEVRTSSLHWIQYWVGTLVGSTVQPTVVVKLEDIQDIRVEEQERDKSTKRHQVILVLRNGQKLGITEAFTSDDVFYHLMTKEDIVSFLKDILPTQLDESDASSEDGESSEDDFEQISQAELESLKETTTTETGDVVDPAGSGDAVLHKEEDGGNTEETEQVPEEGSS